jgi:hypothetical protein
LKAGVSYSPEQRNRTTKSLCVKIFEKALRCIFAHRVSGGKKLNEYRGNREFYFQRGTAHLLKERLSQDKLRAIFFCAVNSKHTAVPFHEIHPREEKAETQVPVYEPMEGYQLRRVFFAAQYWRQCVPVQAGYDWYATEFLLFPESKK